MRIGVVSDTHGQILFTRQAVRMLECLEVGLVIHCGDIGGAGIVPLFAAWPTHFVFGNVDYDHDGLRRAIQQAGQTCHDAFGQLDLEGQRIAFLHGHDQGLLQSTLASGQWHLVCHGHTHVARRERHGGTLLLNPGALYRATPHSLAVVELPQMDATIVPLP